MARVTVEDCIVHIPNRFDLLLVAAQRAKQISSGNPLTIDRDNDKDAVVALREIAEETVDREQLKEDVIQSFFRKPAFENTDKKLIEGEEGADEEVKEAFQDASAHISDGESTPEGEDVPPAGMSFAGEDIEAND